MPHPKQILNRFGISAKSSLGQNFLFDDNLLAQIAAVAELTTNDAVLEIGPGVGALTRHLADASGRVVAVEIDGRLLPILDAELSDCGNVEFVQGDILDLDPADYFLTGYKVVANIPYYLTGAILRHLFSVKHKPLRTVLTVQREVAERIVARPNKMTMLAVSVQLYCQAKIVFQIRAGSFWPRPDVDSAVLRMDLRDRELLNPAEEQQFFRLVGAGFQQRRKQLRGNLRTLGYNSDQINSALDDAGIDGKRRAQTLTVDDWLALHKTLS